MTAPLLIVDSQNKAKTIGDQLSEEVEIIHLAAVPIKIGRVQSPKSERLDDVLSVEPAEAGRELCGKLTASKERDVLLAFDDDQKGDFWSWLIDKYMQSEAADAHRVKQFQPVGLDREFLKRALANAAAVDGRRGESYYIRSLFNSALSRHIKRLLGTASGPSDLPLNYYSLTTVFLLVEREEQGSAFSGAKKWRIKAEMGLAEMDFSATLSSVTGLSGDGVLKDASQGQEVAALLKDAPVMVTAVESDEFILDPPEPYRLTELLQDSFLLLKLQPQEVLDALRCLYEGVLVGDKRTGLISSYMVDIPEDTGTLSSRLRKTVGADQAGAEAQGADDSVDPGGILPLCPDLKQEDLADLDATTRKVYGLIRARALASQMDAAVGDVFTVSLAAGDRCRFEANGHVFTDKGFLEMYCGFHQRDLLRPFNPEAVREGASVSIKRILPEPDAAFQSGHYTFEELYADLADFGIAADPMTVMMLQSMLNRQYLALGDDASILPLDNARVVAAACNRAFPAMMGVNLSAYFAQTVEEVLSGRKSLGFALLQFEQTLMKQGRVLVAPKKKSGAEGAATEGPRNIIRAEEAAPAVEAASSAPPPIEETKVEESQMLSVYEAAEGEQVVSEAAESMAAEDASEVMEEPLPQEAEIRAEDVIDSAIEARDSAISQPSGQEAAATPPETEESVAASGKSAEVFSLSTAPSEPANLKATVQEDAAAMECPLCGQGSVLTKKTPTGRIFYVCQAPECEFMTWSLPHAVPCDICGSPFLVEKKLVGGKKNLRCPRAGCNYQLPMPGQESAEGAVATSTGKRRVRVRRVAGGASGGGTRKVRVVRRRK